MHKRLFDSQADSSAARSVHCWWLWLTVYSVLNGLFLAGGGSSVSAWQDRFRASRNLGRFTSHVLIIVARIRDGMREIESLVDLPPDKICKTAYRQLSSLMIAENTTVVCASAVDAQSA